MTLKRVLLVEGKDDEHVVRHICRAHGVPTWEYTDLCNGTSSLEIKHQGSVELLLRALPVRLKESDIEAIGVIVDADTDLAGRWQALSDRLKGAGYAGIPGEPSPAGTVILPPPQTLLPRAGVWVMPDNRTSGILEDFLSFLVPCSSPLFELAKSSIMRIPPSERRFNKPDEPKALIHTWLAWQEAPGRPLGTAITARYLDPDVPQAKAFVSWLRFLFFQ